MAPHKSHRGTTGGHRTRAVLLLSFVFIAGAFAVHGLSDADPGARAQSGLVTPSPSSSRTVPTADEDSTSTTPASTTPASTTPAETRTEMPVEAPAEQPTEPVSRPSSDAGEAPGEPPEVEPEVEESLDTYISAVSNIAAATATATPNPEAEGPAFEDVAVGNALGSLRAQADEFTANQWSQSGDAAVVEVTGMDESIQDGIPIRTVTACIDSSGVSVSDINGDTIRAEGKPGSRRSLNIYELQERDGAWVVADHRFPADADC